MLRAALQVSKIEQGNELADLEKIPEMKTFYPTEEEFAKGPINYIEDLYKQEAWKYGTVKIVPPPSFRPPLAFDRASSQRVTTRIQSLHNLSEGKVSSYPAAAFYSGSNLLLNTDPFQPFEQNLKGKSF